MLKKDKTSSSFGSIWNIDRLHLGNVSYGPTLNALFFGRRPKNRPFNPGPYETYSNFRGSTKLYGGVKNLLKLNLDYR